MIINCRTIGLLCPNVASCVSVRVQQWMWVLLLLLGECGVGKGTMQFEAGEHWAAEESHTLSCDITILQDLPESNKE